MAHVRFQVGDLTAVIGDNEGYAEHRAGYNGLHWLQHRSDAESVFVPGVAGLNFEHIFDGDQELRDAAGERRVFFEPRRSPMRLRQLAEDTVELYQPATPTFHLESWTVFRLVAPAAVDFWFRCRPQQHSFRYGYIGLFWASYINAPEDRSMYFRHRGQWQQLCSQRHNLHSTVVHQDSRLELQFTPQLPSSLYQNLSPLRFDEPFFYGRVRDLVLIFLFDFPQWREGQPELRLTHSPSGGGYNKQKETANPAWDFQWVIPRYEVMREYRLRGRLICRPRCSRQEIHHEVQTWLRNRDQLTPWKWSSNTP
ncbi:MAG: hypothetical protein RMJ19_06385 [Gemmatales bacterium]|nr:hypothetical protein [Gemmatales bacterium]MCS7160082.1 hypothetical protein [Gemmatales bacterium]MDW8175282.1 hypothetical protein [Gemmatales bacterium]MDW8222840.1 hypothetical protein [Gemmatales bacterium]